MSYNVKKKDKNACTQIRVNTTSEPLVDQFIN